MKSDLMEIKRFLTATDNLISARYSLAEVRISEVLKCIADSEELMRLFRAVTERFDFELCKKTCLLEPEYVGARGHVSLPADRGDALAFIFCIFAEIDRGAIRLSDFLLRYLYEDGSFTASYALFVEMLVRPFRAIVSACYPAAQNGVSAQPIEEEKGLDNLAQKIVKERSRLKIANYPEEMKSSGELILSRLYVACGGGQTEDARALLLGYYYLLVSEGKQNDAGELFVEEF